MKTTRILPTDRTGSIYYGPKTVAQAASLSREMDASAALVADMMHKAGYVRAAAAVRKQFIA